MAAHTTAAKPIQLTDDQVSPEAISLAKRARQRFFKHKMAVVGGFILLGILLFVSAGTLFYSEADANFNDTSLRLQSPSSEFPFGTDTIGRNVLARSIYGGQISLLIGVTSVIMMVFLGTFIGTISGYFGGIIDSVLMRLTEAMLSIPNLLILLVMSRFFSGKIPQQEILGRTFSGSVIVIVFIIGITSWMGLSRLVRSNVLALRETEFVLAARALGATDWRVVLRHILPNTLAPVIVAATLGVAGAILGEAYVSFLGLGVQPPTATWGNMLEGSRQYIAEAPWLWIFPGLLISLTLMSINFVGDGLRDALDPRSDK